MASNAEDEFSDSEEYDEQEHGKDNMKERLEQTWRNMTGTFQVGDKVTALFKFNSRDSDELSIKIQEQLTVVEGSQVQKGFVRVRNDKNKVGMVPQNYVQLAGISQEDDDNKEFLEFCEKYKIGPETRTILERNGLFQLEDLCETTDDEFNTIEINLGQRKALRRGIRDLIAKKQGPIPPIQKVKHSTSRLHAEKPPTTSGTKHKQDKLPEKDQELITTNLIFGKFCNENNINQTTKEILMRNDVGTSDLLAEVTESEFEKMGITYGQKIQILKAVSKVRQEPGPQEPPDEADDKAVDGAERSQTQKTTPFDDFCAKHDIQEKTKKILEENDLQDITLWSNIREDELEKLGVSMGQRKVFISSIKNIKASADGNGENSPVATTTKSTKKKRAKKGNDIPLSPMKENIKQNTTQSKEVEQHEKTEFDKFCEKNRINAKTKKILEDNDVDDILVLDGVSNEELEKMGISLGQRKLVMNGVKEIHGQGDRNVKDIPAKNENMQRLNDENEEEEDEAGNGEEEEEDIEEDNGGDNTKILKFDEETVPDWIERRSGYTNTTTGQHSKTKPSSRDSRIASQVRVNIPKPKGQGHFQNLMTATGTPPTPKKGKNKAEKTRLQRFGSYLKRLVVSDHGDESVQQDNTKTINGITVYQFPLQETHRDDTNRIRKVRIGQTIDTSSQKTILLVGATGSGKSTMIDGMINYIYGMTWEDNHRLTLVELQDDEKAKVSKSESQTEWITAYTIPKSEFSEIPYTVTIVDMPGFGDTRGVQRDKELVGQLKKLFASGGDYGIDSVNSVCFIAKAGDARLTPAQSYIFDQILSLFGNDIKENIQVLITFADGKPPVVMDALKSADVPFTRTFKFNNSALFSSIGSDDQKQPGGDPFTKLFWDMGVKSYAEFFQYISTVSEKSLTLTAKVLKERDELNVIIQILQKKIENAVVKINRHDQLEKSLQENEEAMQTNQNYEMITLKDDVEKVPMKPGEYSTHCTTCNYTCHEYCPQTRTEDLKLCSAMDKKTGECIACPQKCQWSKHISVNYYFKPTVIRVHITKEDVKRNYLQAVEGKKDLEGLIKPIRTEKKKLEDEVKKMVADVTECMQKLDKIALKKGEPSEVDYFNLLIENEKQKCQDGYQDRINMYNSLIKEAKIRENVRKGEVDKLLKK